MDTERTNESAEHGSENDHAQTAAPTVSSGEEQAAPEADAPKPLIHHLIDAVVDGAAALTKVAAKSTADRVAKRAADTDIGKTATRVVKKAKRAVGGQKAVKARLAKKALKAAKSKKAVKSKKTVKKTAPKKTGKKAVKKSAKKSAKKTSKKTAKKVLKKAVKSATKKKSRKR